ncbi:hypothetical protein ACH427_11015 [Streptomyces sp. NPDC020379]|uniref:hypothetical protein n=1 Tax=Streptomyces sp. NPDC020379 TaxID=3365071 RepID=UPI0037A793A3
MRVVVVWWELNESRQTVASLRDFLRDEAVGTWAQVPGLRLKLWISDTEGPAERWGAVFVWESAEAAERPLPTKAGELIGYPPAHRSSFDVEATTEGLYDLARLAGRGLAFA